MLKRVLALILFFVLGMFRIFGQNKPKEFEETENLFLNDRFDAALPQYLNLLKNDSSNQDLNLKIGICYLNSRSEKLMAIPYLEKAAKNQASSYVYKYLGDGYILASKFDLATTAYEKFKETFLSGKPKDLSPIEEINWKIGVCNAWKNLQNINTNQPFPFDYSSALSFDQSRITFTFQRADTNKTKQISDAKYFEELQAQQEMRAQNDDETVSDTTTDKYEAEIANSDSGNLVLIYRDNDGDGDLYISMLEGNQWSKSKKLNKAINRNGWETNQFISPDGNTLYFASNRAGGFGGKDIYACKKSFGGEWSKAINLGSVINTPFDEEAPVMYGRTLFFSSNKNKKKCCFDNLSSTLLNNGSWSEPAKIGYPTHRSEEDIYYATTISHFNETGESGTEHEEENGYVATFTDKNNLPLTILKGKIIVMYGKGLKQGRITVTDNETAEVLGVYSPNYKTGDYIIALPADRNNNITYESEGCLFASENIAIRKRSEYFGQKTTLRLVPLAAGDKTTLNNIFFDPDRTTLLSISNVELNNLFLLLSDHLELAVELSYFIDSKERSKYSVNLAMDRTKMIIDYLVQKGINRERMTAKSPEKLKASRPKKKSDQNDQEVMETTNNKLELKITSTKFK
jgi:outer membrane protein OmpA-like peptidoglycan-associated protein